MPAHKPSVVYVNEPTPLPAKRNLKSSSDFSASCDQIYENVGGVKADDDVIYENHMIGRS